MRVVRMWLERLDDLQRREPVLGFPLAVMKKSSDDDAGSLAALIAYYGFFSLFPLLLVLVSILGRVLHAHPELEARIVSSTLARFPIIGDQIAKNVHAMRGSGVTLVIGLAGALWGGLAVVGATQKGMDDVWGVRIRERAPFLEAKARALLVVVLGGGAVLLASIAGGAGGADATPLRTALGVSASALIDLGVFVMTFRVLTAANVSVRDVLPGAMLAASAWTVLQAVGGYLVGHQLAQAGTLYGFFGIVLGLLSWLYLGAQVTLLGAEMNVVRIRQLWPRSLTGESLTDADRRALVSYARIEERHPAESVVVHLRPARERLSAGRRGKRI